jgi:oligopeptide transport system substrate-binding protein
MRPPRRLVLLAVLITGVLPACFLSKAKPASTVPAGPASEIRIGIRQPSTLDPALRANPSDLLIADQIFDPLVGFDPGTDALVPKLASSWDVQDGGSRFVFHLRPDALFQNGVSVTASDVAFSLNRLAQKATGSSLAYLLAPVQGFDDVNVTGTSTSMSGVQVLDEHTLQISLSAPWVDFPYALTDPATAPIPAATFQANPSAFMQHPVGAGPYELEASSGLNSLVLQRFDGYWGPRPAIDVVRFIANPSPAAVLGDLGNGTLDVGEVPPASMTPAIAKFGSTGFTPLAAGIYLGFNLTDPALSDLRLRDAVSLAIDRQAIASQIYGNVVGPADGIVPTGLPGHSELSCGVTCTYLPAQARVLVQQAFPSGPPSITLNYPSGDPNQAVASAIATDLKAVGITVVLSPQSPIDYLATLNANTQEMYLEVWVADYPLADWFLTPLFGAGSLDNHTGYQNGPVQALLAKARSTADPTQRLALYSSVEQSVLSDMAMSPIGFFRNHYAASGRVQDFYVDPLGGFQVARFHLAS